MKSSVKYKNYIITILSSVFLLYTLTILDFLSIGSKLYLDKSHGACLENFNMMVFTSTTVAAQCLFGGLSRLRAGICGGVIFESVAMTNKIHEVCEQNSTTTTESLTNAYFAIMISTILFGLLSYILGMFGMGKLFDFIPRTPLYGVMASIGIGLISGGFKEIYVDDATKIIHASAFATIILVSLAYYLESKFPGYVFFIPLYLCFITSLFYGGFYLFGYDIYWLRHHSLVPDISSSNITASDFLKYLEFSAINFRLILILLPRILALTFTNMIHITVNVPGFSSVMNLPASINEEFKTQGIANFFTAFLGYPSYFINCTSVLFNKSGGTTKFHAIIGGITLIGLFYIGPKSRELLPRILLAFIPVYIGGGFVISNILDHIFVISYTDLVIILVSTAVGIFDPITGLIAGIALQSLIILVGYMKWISHHEKVDLYYDDIQKTYEIVKIDFMAFFLTYDKLIKKLQVDGPKILIDLRECPYIDHEGNNILSKLISEIKGEVLMIGSPNNLYTNRFKNYLV